MELIGIIIAAIIAFFGALSMLDRRRVALLEQDLDLDVVQGPQENYKDTVGFLLKNIGGNVSEPTVEPGPNVQVQLQKAISQGGDVMDWPSGYRVRMVAKHTPPKDEKVEVPTTFNFYITFVNTSGRTRRLKFLYTGGEVTTIGRETIRLRLAQAKGLWRRLKRLERAKGLFVKGHDGVK